MPVISAALSVLVARWIALLGLLVVTGTGCLLTFGLLRRGLDDALDAPETLLLALSGWPMLWLFCAIPAFFVNRALDFGPAWGAFLFSLFGLLILSGWKKMAAPFGRPGWLFWGLAVAFFLALFTRLAFLAELVVPAYVDGALHYSISQSLLTDFGAWPWQNPALPLGGYYHAGFHLLTAVFAAALGLKVSEVILLFGQILLAALPFPAFFIVRRETGSVPAAFFTLLLAGWGWSMPAHALNWGKYPALAGLLALQFSLALAYFASRTGLAPRKNRFLLGLILAASIAAALMHSRALVVIALAAFSDLAAGYAVARANRLARALILALMMTTLAGLVAYLQSREILKLVFDPYLRPATGWMTLLVLLLSPLAFRRSARLALTSLMTLLLLLACMLIPAPGAAFQTLLDRPFAQMTLYLPLAWLGGLGLAGLLELVKNNRRGVALVTVCAFGLVLLQAGLTYNFRPSSCCQLFKQDDAVAVEMIKSSLPKDARIVIAGNTLNVLDIENSGGLQGSDGGLWLSALTGQKTFLWPYRTNFSSAETFADLCARGMTFIYAGGARESFSVEQLLSKPEQYPAWLSLPGAHLFEVVGCP